MRILFRLLPLFLGLAAIAPAAHARDVVGKGDTVVVELSGEISPPMHLFLRRAIKAAENAGAGAIIIEMNTYGGRLDSAGDISGALNRTTLPTYTFINTNAGSAGSLIALATRNIYMSPVGAIGAAAPSSRPAPTCPRRKRENAFVLVGARPQLRHAQRPQSRHRRGVHEQRQGSENRRPRRQRRDPANLERAGSDRS